MVQLIILATWGYCGDCEVGWRDTAGTAAADGYSFCPGWNRVQSLHPHGHLFAYLDHVHWSLPHQLRKTERGKNQSCRFDD
jgi:hypothetical protein